MPYMAPGLVGKEKAARGKLPTDVWWHTIVPTDGKEKTGYPTQKPEGVLRRIVAAVVATGGPVLDFFAGSGTTGAVAAALGPPVRAGRREPPGGRGDAGPAPAGDDVPRRRRAAPVRLNDASGRDRFGPVAMLGRCASSSPVQRATSAPVSSPSS